MKEQIIENGIQYTLHGDYYLPDLKLQPETRPIGRWGRMHREFLREYKPIIFNQLCLSGELWSRLADINEQAQQRLEVMIRQMMIAEGVTEKLKETKQMEWIQRATTIQILAKDIILNEMIFA